MQVNPEGPQPMNPITGAQYDSAIIYQLDQSGKQFKRLLVYDPNQVNPEYAVVYNRCYSQQFMQLSQGAQVLPVLPPQQQQQPPMAYGQAAAAAAAQLQQSYQSPPIPIAVSGQLSACAVPSPQPQPQPFFIPQNISGQYLVVQQQQQHPQGRIN